METGDVINCLVIDINTKDWLFVGTLIPEVIQMAKDAKISKVRVHVSLAVTVLSNELCKHTCR